MASPPYSTNDPVVVKTTDVSTSQGGGMLPFLIPALVGAAGSIAGGLIQSDRARSAANRARDWEERMSATSHQREVEDLRKAGLNPILSGMGGSGAGYHSVAAEQVPQMDPAAGAASALQAKRLEAELEVMESQSSKNDAEASYLAEQEATHKALRPETLQQAREQWHLTSRLSAKADQERLNEAARAPLIAREGLIQSEALQTSRATAAQAKQMEKIHESDFGKILLWIDRISKSVQGVSDVLPTPRGGGINIHQYPRAGGLRKE